MGEGKLTASPLAPAVAAASVGIVGGRPLLDLCYTEDVTAAVDMNLVMNADGRFIEVQGTGEETTYSREELSAMLDLGTLGIRRLLELQQEALA